MNLFHYISYQGLIGVTEKKCLWATERRHLDDASDFKIAASHLVQELERRAASVDEQGPRLPGLMARLQEEIFHKEHHLFLVPFSEADDLFKQEDSCATRGVGISLGFGFDVLSKACAAQGFSLVRCIYNESEKVAVVRDLVDQCLGRLRARPVVLPLKQDQQFDADMIADLSEIIILGLSAFKSSAVSKGKEWRAVKFLNRIDPKISAIKVQVNSEVVIPHLEFKLPTVDGFLQRPSSWHVHSADGSANAGAVSLLLSLHCRVRGDDVTVKSPSQAPLRLVS